MGFKLEMNRRPRPLAVGVLLAAILGGCATVTLDVSVDVPTLPPALLAQRPLRIGVHFSEALRNAHTEISGAPDAKPFTRQYRIGAASVAVFRQAMRSTFAEVVEVGQTPSRAAVDRTLAALLVPGTPVVRSEWLITTDTWRYAQTLQIPVALHATTGELLAQWTVGGSAALADYADAAKDLQHAELDEGLLRNVGAALIASFVRQPALTALQAASPDAAEAPGAARVASKAAGLAVLRLDTGLAHGDAIEQRIADCVARAMTRASSPARQIRSQALRDAVFPWFEPGLLPDERSGFEAALGRPLLQQRLQQLGVGHLVLFTVQRSRHVTGDAPVPTQFGFAGPYEERRSEIIEATVWDVAAQRAVADGRSVTVRTTSRFGGVLPLPVVRTNEAQACTQLQSWVRNAVGNVSRP